MNEKQHHDLFYEIETNFFEGTFIRLFRQRIAKFVFDKCRGKDRSKRVLSIGLGDGFYEISLAPFFEHITGLDISSVAVRKSRSKAKEGNLSNITFIQGDIRSLNLGDKYFDCIWILSTLHHLNKGDMTILKKKCFEHLTPYGILITIDPSSKRFVSLFKVFFKKLYSCYHSPDEKELSISITRQLLTTAGFKKISLVYVDFFIAPLAWAFPNIPFLLARSLLFFNSIFIKIPILRSFSSSFALVAQKNADIVA